MLSLTLHHTTNQEATVSFVIYFSLPQATLEHSPSVSHIMSNLNWFGNTDLIFEAVLDILKLFVSSGNLMARSLIISYPSWTFDIASLSAQQRHHYHHIITTNYYHILRTAPHKTTAKYSIATTTTWRAGEDGIGIRQYLLMKL